MKYLLLLASFIIMITVCSCKPADKAEQMLRDYNMASPEKFFMPESLQEVSGISFHKQKGDTIYAIQDEEGKLFRLAWNKKKQYHSKFGKNGDYEDLAIVNNKVVILKSNGSLITFPFEETIYQEIDSAKEWKHLLPGGEYESLYGDESSGNLFVLCKTCPADGKKDVVSGYILKAADSIFVSGSFEINVHDINCLPVK